MGHCAIVTALLIGRQQGIEGSTDVAGTVCFILLVSIAVYVTLDLNRPESGRLLVTGNRLSGSYPEAYPMKGRIPTTLGSDLARHVHPVCRKPDATANKSQLDTTPGTTVKTAYL
jgi:hypothetical protein